MSTLSQTTSDARTSPKTNGDRREKKDEDKGDSRQGENGAGCGALDYDYLVCTIPDIHGSPRGRVASRDIIPRVLKHGFGLFRGVGNFPVTNEYAEGQTEYQECHPNATLLPLMDTIRPLHWSSTPGGRSVGHVTCQLLFKGQLDPVCSRDTLLRQIRRLNTMGLRLKSAFELEFMVFEGGDPTKPLGGGRKQFANADLLSDDLDFFMDLMDTLKASGLPVEFCHGEPERGQYEITLQPREGVGAADAAFMARYGIRAFSRRRGLQATFMARPVFPEGDSRFHLNHSLWTTDGENAFTDASDPMGLSSLARHWLAGLLHHAPVLFAISNPTVNCYECYDVGLSPSEVYWNVDDRNCCVRAKVGGSSGSFLENRLPSSACNPYLALAATIAAGLDGVERKLACPEPGTPKKDQVTCTLPLSLEEALDTLDKDVVLKEAVGPKVLSYLSLLKRNHELAYFKANTTPNMSRAERVEVQRKYYMPYI